MPNDETEDLLQEGLTETQQEIFDAALSDEKPADEPEPVAEEVVEEKEDQPRNALGQFSSKQEEKPAETKPVETKPVEAPKPTETDHRVPLREHLDERERRIQLQRQVEYLTAQLQQLQRPQQPTEAPDIFADPNAFMNHTIAPLRQELGAEIGKVREGFSRIIAIEKYGEEAINAAYSELERQMQIGQGQYDYAKIMQSPHPFGELVAWHKRFHTQQQIGGDLEGYLKKREDELLNDPAFMQKVADKLRGQQSQPNGKGKPAPNVQMPPSLNRVTASASRTAGEEDMDTSDSALFRHALS